MLPSIPEVSTAVETVIDRHGVRPAAGVRGRVVYFNATMEPCVSTARRTGHRRRHGSRSRVDACRHPHGRAVEEGPWERDTIGDDRHEWGRNYQMRGDHQTTDVQRCCRSSEAIGRWCPHLRAVARCSLLPPTGNPKRPTIRPSVPGFIHSSPITSNLYRVQCGRSIRRAFAARSAH